MRHDDDRLDATDDASVAAAFTATRPGDDDHNQGRAVVISARNIVRITSIGDDDGPPGTSHQDNGGPGR